MSRTADLLVLLLVFFTVSCSGDGGELGYQPVPRPDAWPRPALHDTVLVCVPGLPVNIEANADAVVSSSPDSPGAVDIAYPRYRAVVYLSLVTGLSSPEQFRSVWENRMDRMRRNLGSVSVSAENGLNGNGFHTVLLYVGSLSQTPVQLLAGNPDKGMIVSATAFLHDRPLSYDSIRPVFEAIRSDLERMALRLR